MKCDVIFYLAKKTALCQKKLGEMLTVRGYELNTITAATSPQSLGMQLTDDLNCVNLVFIVGGLRDNDIRGISNVFSKALANSSTGIIPKRLKNEVGLFDGYILRSGKQTIICIPDTPKEIESVLNEPLLNYLDRIYFGD